MLHSHCYAAYRRARQACPVCSVPWDRDSEGKLKRVGEGAFVEEQDKHARAKRKRDEDGEGAGNTQPSQTQKKGKGKGGAKGKGKGKGKAQEENMEVDTKEEEPSRFQKMLTRTRLRRSPRRTRNEEVNDDDRLALAGRIVRVLTGFLVLYIRTFVI